MMDDEVSDDSSVESLKPEAGKSDQRTSNVAPNDLRAVKTEAGDLISSHDLYDPKEFRITRKSYDLANMK